MYLANIDISKTVTARDFKRGHLIEDKDKITKGFFIVLCMFLS